MNKTIISALVFTMMLFMMVMAPFNNVYALGFDKDSKIDIVGGNCGVPNSDINKCCRPIGIKIDLDPGVSIPGVSGIADMISSLVNMVLGGVGDAMGGVISNMTGDKTKCIPGADPTTTDANSPNCLCVQKGQTSSLFAAVGLCNTISSKDERKSCSDCILGNNKEKRAGIWTAIGCVQADASSFIQNTLLGWGIGLAGTLSLLCIIYASFLMQMSRGNPERIKKAQELLTSCIIGLFLIIFSIFILKFIGVTILRIPGFS